MNIIKYLSIKTKIWFIAAIGLVSLSIVSIIGFNAFNASKSSFDDFKSKQLHLISISSNIAESIATLQNVFLTSASSQLKLESDYKAKNEAIKLELKNSIEKLEKLASLIEFIELKKIIENISLRTQALSTIGLGMVETFTDKSSDTEDKVDSIASYNSVAIKTKEELKVLNDFSKKSLDGNIALFEDKLSNYEYQIIFIACVAFILLIAVSIFLISNIQGSIIKFQQGLLSFFSFLSRETDKAEMINLDSKDEFGQMAIYINENIMKIEAEIIADDQFIKNTQEVMNRVQNGWFTQHIEANTNNLNLQNLKQTINQSLINLRANFVLMNNTLEEYCNYDYTKELKITNIEPNGVFDTLIKDINKLRDSITQMLQDSLQVGVDLQSEAGTLKQAVESLSTASNQQAASLEETAAAMEEMTSNVQNNVQKSNEMATMANQTDSAAKDGAELAKRTSTAMTEIQTATNSINDAVAIIENIAFQTNILSLNAAVEAATAGDAGKGFAVVAQEVRNLANRSADAAKEIKTMAALAANKSNEGMNIATELTRGFEVIADKIAQTAIMVQDVSNANKEQMQGIGQINTAVTQLDQMTQENAKVAAQADAIANATIQKAQAMVEDTLSKEFIGKNEISYI
ncbi:methyl-accepting chemotaxis protein [Sulfurimonas sp.]|uniref:methyl-accepting chemotaxis protein n=1 Tax=Sulfurimonas sp. TaxID=2022749 RepID=UPI0026059582|nr:methyl-accepting chemotaxis protein [Sulfurimonas sp.]MDD3855849.1 methyl-accepting chemotaxis protein [Sulfurimonas sp.]